MLGGAVDWIALLEAAHAPVATHDAWANQLVDVARVPFAERERVGFFAFRHPPDCSSLEPLVASEWMKTLLSDANGPLPKVTTAMGPALIRRYYYPPAPVSTAMALSEGAATDHRRMARRTLAELDIGDTLGLVMHPMPGVASVLFVARSKKIELRPAEHRTLSQIALHIEAGLRLRLRPESVKAVLTPTGRVEHWEADAPDRDDLKAHVRHVESARRMKNRRDAAALDAWTALVRGQVSLVERSEGGRRYYLFVDNAPAQQPIRALTKGEVDAVAHASRGHSSKMVAYGLGVRESTVSARLANAANKIGLGTRMDVVRVAAMLARDPRAGFQDIVLTTAERDVLELVSMGLTNAEIARMRNRSARTIANQVASLLAKTGAPGRRALVVKHSR